METIHNTEAPTQPCRSTLLVTVSTQHPVKPTYASLPAQVEGCEPGGPWHSVTQSHLLGPCLQRLRAHQSLLQTPDPRAGREELHRQQCGQQGLRAGPPRWRPRVDTPRSLSWRVVLSPGMAGTPIPGSRWPYLLGHLADSRKPDPHFSAHRPPGMRIRDELWRNIRICCPVLTPTPPCRSQAHDGFTQCSIYSRPRAHEKAK